jgi:hypothetical protein
VTVFTFTMDVELKSTSPLHVQAKSDESVEPQEEPAIQTTCSSFLEKEPGLKQCEKESFYGKSTHILGYDVPSVRSFLAVILSPDITAFATSRQWLDHIGMLLYAIFLMLILGNNAFPDNSMGEMSACSDDDPKRNRNMCQLEDVMANAKDDFQFLIAFMLAGYVAGSLASWASRKTIYAALCGSVRNIIILVTSSVPNDPNNAEVTLARKTMARWTVLAFELAILKVCVSICVVYVLCLFILKCYNARTLFIVVWLYLAVPRPHGYGEGSAAPHSTESAGARRVGGHDSWRETHHCQLVDADGNPPTGGAPPAQSSELPHSPDSRVDDASAG